MGLKRIYEIDPLECPMYRAQMRIVAFIQDEHGIKDIMKSQGVPDFFIRRSLGVVGQAPPPIRTFIDTFEAIDEIPCCDFFEKFPDHR